jgi:hypothetical protein
MQVFTKMASLLGLDQEGTYTNEQRQSLPACLCTVQSYHTPTGRCLPEQWVAERFLSCAPTPKRTSPENACLGLGINADEGLLPHTVCRLSLSVLVKCRLMGSQTCASQDLHIWKLPATLTHDIR